MNFGTTLGEHLTMNASPNMKVVARMQTLKYINCFLNSGFLVTIVQRKISGDLT